MLLVSHFHCFYIKTISRLVMERGSRSQHSAEFGHFTSLFCRRLQMNVPRIVRHLHSHCSVHWIVLDFSPPEFYSRPFRLFPASTNCPWISEGGDVPVAVAIVVFKFKLPNDNGDDVTQYGGPTPATRTCGLGLRCASLISGIPACFVINKHLSK